MTPDRGLILALATFFIGTGLQVWGIRGPWLGVAITAIGGLGGLWLIATADNVRGTLGPYSSLIYAGLMGAMIAGSAVWYFTHKPPATIDELRASYIRHREFSIADLARAGNSTVIRDKTIEDSTIHGPAVVWGYSSGKAGATLQDLRLEFSEGRVGRPRVVFWTILNTAQTPSGAITLEGVTLRRCRLIDISFAGTEAAVTEWAKEMKPR